MHRLQRQLFERLKSEVMTTSEREHVREALFAHMEQHPVGDDALVRRMLAGGGAFKTPKPRFAFSFKFAPAMAMVLFLALLGGASYAAEGAVPGDALYSVKIHVNEPIRTVIVWDPAAKIAWDAELIERRLQEAEKLAARGELTEEKSALLSESVTKHSEALVMGILAMEDDQDPTAALDSRIEAAMTLEGHDDVLLDIAAGTMASASGGDMADADVARIIEAIRATTESLASVDVENPDLVDAVSLDEDDHVQAVPAPSDEVIETANVRYKQAEMSIADARTLLAENRDALSELIALQASRILRRADEQLYEGEAKLQDRLYLAATASFLEARRLATRAQLLIETNLELNVEIVIEEPPIEEDAVTEEEPPVQEEPPVEEEPPINNVLLSDVETVEEEVLPLE